MTFPSVIRIFFAVDLPPATKDRLREFITALKRQSKTNVIRWSKPENLHITLQFLAEVKSEDVVALIQNVKKEISTYHEQTPLRLGRLALFPDPYRPRVIVLDVAPQGALLALSQAIGRGIQNTRYAIEDRPYRAHLTLGRIKHPQGVNLSFISQAELPDVPQIELNEVVLFRSIPQPEGSVYAAVERMPLPVMV